MGFVYIHRPRWVAEGRGEHTKLPYAARDCVAQKHATHPLAQIQLTGRW